MFICFGVFTTYKLLYFKIEDSEKFKNFSSWKNGRILIKHSKPKDTTYQCVITSPLMLIDKIYRSMEGPMVAKEYFIDKSIGSLIASAFDPELLWITGYKVELFNEAGEKISEDFMCHNNLNIGKNNILPWKLKTLGTDTRLFTLTEGQTEVHLPEGYGIPIMSNQRCRVDFQVLNHNIPNINMHIKQVVTVFYKKDAECKENIIPLYQQSVFITKQFSGPEGKFDAKPDNDININSDLATKTDLCCSNPGRFSSEGYPFKDKYNRSYTGHWELSDSIEYLSFNVTPMLNLVTDSKAHFISVHIHPFCESLELFDHTDSCSIFKAIPTNFETKIGVKKIPAYSSPDGELLFKGHSYELRSVYHKKKPERHTAMATMFLYLEED